MIIKVLLGSGSFPDLNLYYKLPLHDIGQIFFLQLQKDMPGKFQCRYTLNLNVLFFFFITNVFLNEAQQFFEFDAEE